MLPRDSNVAALSAASLILCHKEVKAQVASRGLISYFMHSFGLKQAPDR